MAMIDTESDVAVQNEISSFSFAQTQTTINESSSKKLCILYSFNQELIQNFVLNPNEH